MRKLTITIIMLFLMVSVVSALENLDKDGAWLIDSGHFSTNEKQFAIDDNNATQWISGGEHPAWWKVVYPSAREITRVSLNNYGGEQNGIYSFLFQYSDDDSNWVNGWEKTSADGVLYNYSFTNESMGVHKYWRMYDIHRDSGSNYANIQEIYFWNGTDAVPSNPVSKVLLLQPNKETFPLVNVEENDFFYMAGNYTLLGVPLEGGNCNFTANNITYHEAINTKDNVSLNISSSQLSLSLNEGFTNATVDHVSFSVCREGLKTPLQIYKDGGLFSTIDQNVIPVCSMGTHFENSNTTSWLNDSNVNITLACSACNGGSKKLTIVSTNNISLSINRDFSTHTEDLTYNITTSLYEKTHLYHYSTSGINVANITLNCNGTIDSELFTVGNLNLSIEIVSINDDVFVEGMNLESTNTTIIVIEITGDVVSAISFNVTYSNGTVIKTSSQEFISLSNDNLDEDGTYNISITAIDDEGNPTSLNSYFLINDTTAPQIVWKLPNPDNSSTYATNTNVTINFSVYDINLFAYNYSVRYPNGTLYLNESFVGGISADTLNFSRYINVSVQGVWRLDLEVADSHHLYGKQKVDSWKVDKPKSDTLEFNDCLEIEFEGAYNVGTTKYDYFYDFSVGYDSPSMSRHIKIKSKCGTLYYLSDSPFNAHFALYGDSMRAWIDFEGVSETPNVQNMGNNTYELTFYNLPDEVTFNSIGGLNSVSKTVLFTVFEPSTIGIYESMGNNTPSSWTRQLDLESTSGVFLLFFLLSVTVLMTVMGAITHPAVLMFASIMWFFLGWIVLMNVSMIFGGLIMFFGLFLLFGSMMGD